MNARREWLTEHRDVRRDVRGQRMDTPHWDANKLGEAARAAASDQLPLTADIFQTRPTRAAIPAGDLRVDSHSRPDQEFPRRPPCGYDFAGQFVPHDQRRLAARTARSYAVQIRAADASRLDPEQNLAGARPWAFNLADLKVVRLRVQKGLHHLTTGSSFRPSSTCIRNVRSLSIASATNTWRRSTCAR